MSDVTEDPPARLQESSYHTSHTYLSSSSSSEQPADGGDGRLEAVHVGARWRFGGSHSSPQLQGDVVEVERALLLRQRRAVAAAQAQGISWSSSASSFLLTSKDCFCCAYLAAA